jgi:lipoate-protein ligase A
MLKRDKMLYKHYLTLLNTQLEQMKTLKIEQPKWHTDEIKEVEERIDAIDKEIKDE